MTPRSLLLAIVLATAPCAPFSTAVAQDSKPPVAEISVGDRALSWEKLYRAKKDEYDHLKAEIGIANGKLYNSWAEFAIEDYRYRQAIKDLNIHTLQDQRAASYVMMCLVALITIAGLYFAYMQLSAGVTRPFLARRLTQPSSPDETSSSTDRKGSATEKDAADKTQSEHSTMSLSLTGLSVTTSAIGVLILLISLAFTYLYLEKVYAISIIDPMTLTIQTSARKATEAAATPSVSETPASEARK